MGSTGGARCLQWIRFSTPGGLTTPRLLHPTPQEPESPCSLPLRGNLAVLGLPERRAPHGFQRNREMRSRCANSCPAHTRSSTPHPPKARALSPSPTMPPRPPGVGSYARLLAQPMPQCPASQAQKPAMQRPLPPQRLAHMALCAAPPQSSPPNPGWQWHTGRPPSSLHRPWSWHLQKAQQCST